MNVELANDPSRPIGRDDFTPDSGARPASLRTVFSGLQAAVVARVQLFELEAQRAAGSIAKMVGFAVAAALLVVTAWLIVAGGITYAAVLAGVPWWLGVLLVIAVHLLGAWLLVGRIMASLKDVSFAASRRSLVPKNFSGSTDAAI